MPKQQTIKTTTVSRSHKIRTFLASIAGIFAVYLILSSVTVVWLNRTLTNTSVYVDTVAPLVNKPAIQNYLAQKVTNEIITKAPSQGLATALLPAAQLNAGLPNSQIQSLLGPILQDDVLQIIRSPSFANLWRSTNQSAQAQLVSDLKSNNGQLQLDLSPAVNGIINELKSSQLSSVANQISLDPNSANLDIKGVGVSKAHRYYKLFQAGTIGIIVAAIIAIGLSVWLSEHHGKTARRILMWTGILALLEALVLEIPAFIKLKGQDQITQNAIRAFVEQLTHNLQLASLILGIICILGAIGSKAYLRFKS
jgi:hypothetical protein